MTRQIPQPKPMHRASESVEQRLERLERLVLRTDPDPPAQTVRTWKRAKFEVIDGGRRKAV